MKGLILLVSIFLIINATVIFAQDNSNSKRLGFLIEDPNCILIGNTCNNSIPCCQGLSCTKSNICGD